jgi:lipoprotein-releasing system ATP-binding protein lolD
MSILEVKNISKKFIRGDRGFYALEDVSFSVDKSELVYIKGKSGSGKSTLLNLIAGLLRPDSGSVNFNGVDISTYSDEKISEYRNVSIGYVPQSLGTLPNLTIAENVELPFHIYKKQDSARERALMLLDKMHILELKDEFPRSLSGGELKRVLLARALMNEPELIITDELTSDLDSATTKDIMKILYDIHESGTTLIMVTHDDDIIRDKDRVIHMEAGKLTE